MRLIRERQSVTNKDEHVIIKLLEELPVKEAQLLSEGRGYETGAAHNNSIFHTSGVKLTWGDISIRNIEELARLSEKHKTTLFILDEMSGYWGIRDEDRIVARAGPSKDPFSRSVYRDMLPAESIIVKSAYLEKNAWLKIKNGTCFKRNPRMGETKWSEASWDEFKALCLGEPLKEAKK